MTVVIEKFHCETCGKDVYYSHDVASFLDCAFCGSELEYVGAVRFDDTVMKKEVPTVNFVEV